MNGNDIKIFISPKDTGRNINNAFVDFQRVTLDRNVTFSELKFEITRSVLHFNHVSSLNGLLCTIKEGLNFILYDNNERIYAREFF